MRKFVLAIFVVAIVSGVYLYVNRAAIEILPSEDPKDAVLGTTSSPSPVVDFVSTPFVSGEAVTLIPNYTERLTSDEIQSKYECEYLVNAGFYTKENTPVGLFQSGTTVLRNERSSSLFDGFVTVNELRTPRITRSLPTDRLALALQTGPILIENGKEAPLSIKNDEQARRMVAVVSADNKISFVMIQSSLLQALPSVLMKWAQDNKVIIADAINLDGGSASTFRGPQIIFPEITSIGSAFCIKTNS